jgi:excinuclease ABC subunit C
MPCSDRKKIEQLLTQLPEAPGVYEFKDCQGEVLYVGKSRNLKKRVSSYFQREPESPRIRKMVGLICGIDYIVTGNEAEALMLECNLIKKVAPAYNVLFRDDKTYPFIRLNMRAEYPYVEKTRQQIKGDGALYFGPFADEFKVNEILRFIERHFKLVKCSRYKFACNRSCIEYQIGRCPGPCVQEIDRVAYNREVEAVKTVLAGNYNAILKDLKSQMQIYADNMDYEKAAAVRDQINALSILNMDQDATALNFSEEDYLAISVIDGFYLLQHLLVRKGRIINQEKVFGQESEAETAEIMIAWMKQHYTGIVDCPPEIVLPAEYDRSDFFELVENLCELTGRKISLCFPKQGRKKRLSDMAARNAAESLRVELFRRESSGALLLDIQRILQLSVLPYRVECFDISNLQGNHTVAAMSVAENGLIKKGEFRRFRLPGLKGPDDFAAMREVLTRRYGRLQTEKKALPDLVIVDGGMGQLGAAAKALYDLGLENMEIASLAKREELIHSLRFPNGLQLGPHSAVRLFFQRLRDEVHDFAIRYHRKLRDKAATHSFLDEIPGVGPKRKTALLKRFSNLNDIVKYSPAELAAELGFPVNLAEKIIAVFKQKSL